MTYIKYVLAKALKIILNPPAIDVSSKIHKTSRVCAKSELSNCFVDRYSYIGYRNFMVNVEIGSFCSIADRCSMGGAAHPMEFVSTSPVFHKGKNILGKNFSKHEIKKSEKVIIENDVWIGQGVFIKQGVKISTGAVIGMGSVVTHDVGPYEIWAGNPARFIKKRFDDNTINSLLEIKWWEWDEEKLRLYGEYFSEPKKLIKIVNSKRETI